MKFKPRDIVYISGAMSAYKDTDWGRKNFLEAEEFLHNTFGCRVLNPARSFCSRTDLELVEYMRMDLHYLLQATGIYVLKDHEISEGSQFEQFVARKLELKFLFEEASY